MFPPPYLSPFGRKFLPPHALEVLFCSPDFFLVPPLKCIPGKSTAYNIGTRLYTRQRIIINKDGLFRHSNKLNKVHAQRYALIMINRDGLFENHTVVRHYFGYNFFLLRKFAIRSKHLYSNQDIALRMHNSTSKSDRPFYTGGVGGPSKPWAGTPNISKL